MGKLAEFELKPERSKFRVGEKIKGVLNIKADTDITLKKLWVHINGQATAGSLQESYLNDNIFIGLNGTDETQRILPGSPQTFDFEFELPINIPPTFSCKFCCIQYYLQASLVTTHRDTTLTTPRISFTIVPHVNLNNLPSVALRQTATASSNYKSGLFGSEDPVSMRFVTSRSGFTPKEYVLFAVEVNNNSGVVFDTPSIQLHRVITLDPHGSRKQAKTELLHTAKFGGECRSHRKVLWTAKRFRLPADLPPSHLPHCGIIDVSYLLKVILPSRKDLTVSLPIIVGTVALTILHPEVAERQRRESDNDPTERVEPPPAYDAIMGELSRPMALGEVECHLEDNEGMPGGPPPYSLTDPANVT